MRLQKRVYKICTHRRHLVNSNLIFKNTETKYARYTLIMLTYIKDSRCGSVSTVIRLRAGRPENRGFQWMGGSGRSPHHGVQTGYGAHPACPMHTRDSFLREQSGRSVKLTTPFYLAIRQSMRGALLYVCSWRCASLCTETALGSLYVY
jgi:hypothetical protein